MSIADVAKGERMLAKIGGALGITPEGTQWLKAAVDPFHDTPLQVCGYPDTNEASSVVQVVRVSAQVSAPAAATGNWDCHFHSFPWMSVTPGAVGVIQGNSLAPTTAGFGPILFAGTNVPTDSSSCPMGNIGYHAVPAGNPTWLSNAVQPNVQFPLLSTLGPYLTGEYRIIARGWEVINTTSELNIQGLVTVYREPYPDIDSAKSTLVYRASSSTNGNGLFGYPDVLWDVFPPQSSGSALLLDGSKQWKAKEGCYIVDTLNSEEIPTGPDMTCMALILPTTDPQFVNNAVALYGGGWNQVFAIPPTTPTNNIYAWSPNGLLPTKFNHSGAYFTGLSQSTTLQLNAIYYIERFPTQQDTDLVVLAKHSCRSDNVARSLYSEIIRDMPVGVPQRMNGMGEWFADAVSSAANFVAPVLGAIPTPITQGLSGLARTAGNVAAQLGSKREAPSVYSATGANTAVKSKVKAPAKKKKAVVVQKKKKK